MLTTANGTQYFTEPQVAAIAQTITYMPMAYDFLQDFDTDYLNDYPIDDSSTELIKFAGQLCYLSFGQGRTKNKDAQKYIDHLLESGHGSVLEHASVSFLLWGVSRSFTHELVRHRAGFAFSQVSQRYVNKPRFVERPEYQNDEYLHRHFEARIDDILTAYNNLITYLKSGMPLAERKEIQQVARSILPNEAEAPIVVTANLRAWRHFITMRADPSAETEIQRVARLILASLKEIAPPIFNDFSDDGVPKWRKV